MKQEKNSYKSENNLCKQKKETEQNLEYNNKIEETSEQYDTQDIEQHQDKKFDDEPLEILNQDLIQSNENEIVNWNVISAFNGLRGLFVSMVLLYHINTTIFFIGEQGVDGFLVMSGWLNALSFEKLFKKSKFFKATKNFFIRRIFRILPVYYLLLIMIFIFMGKENKDQCSKDIQKMIFMYQNFYNYGRGCWSVTWSLALEVQLYLSIPVIILSFVKNKRFGYILISVIFMILIFFAILNSQQWQWDRDGFQFQRSINFFLGIFAYYFVCNIKKVSQKTAKICITLSIVTFLILQTILYITLIIYDKEILNTLRAINYSSFAPLVCLFVFGCQHYQNGQANQIMQNEKLLFMNKISYSLYLFHLFLKNFIEQHFEKFVDKLEEKKILDVYRVVCYIPMIIFCAYLFDYFEKPFIKYGHQIEQ